jgi:hypothetical protein
VDSFDQYWRFRIEKEIWLKKLMGKVQGEAREGKATLAEAAAKWSRPGLPVKFHSQETPVDQYEVEKIAGLGTPNCPLRYSLNSTKESDLGKVHPEVLAWSARGDRLEERGWLLFVLRRIVPDEVPPLASVREKVVSEALDERAREAARQSLEVLRREAEGARQGLEEAAKAKGLETAEAGPFHEFTWRPQAPRPSADETGAPPEEGWKRAERRQSTVMARYAALRETPVGSFSSVLDDSHGTGAFYLVQVKSRAEPAFEEMTQAQQQQVKRVLLRERAAAMDQELSYGRLRERYNLMVAGQPAPPPEERGRGRER